jgi:ArsR family transcriptional regulator, virulence genes transcriptional regulator
MKRTATRVTTAMAPADDFDASAMRKHSGAAARLMRSLANRQRLLVLCALTEGELSVSELNRRVTLSQSALSQHLAVLRSEQLVSTRRDAQTIYYSLADGPAVRVLQLLHDEFCGSGESKRGR